MSITRTLYFILGFSALSGCSVLKFQSEANLPTNNATVAADQAASLPEGAHVIIMRRLPNQVTKTEGTVLKASNQGIALYNTTVEHRAMTGNSVLIKTPYVSRFFKNTGIGVEQVPVLWVPLEAMTSFHITEPPPEGFVSLAVALDTSSGPKEIERIGIDFDFNAPPLRE